MLLVEREKRFGGKPRQPFFGTHPKIALLVFKESIDPVEWHPFVVKFNEKAACAKAVEPTVSADPEIAFAVFANGADERIRQPVAGVIGVKVSTICFMPIIGARFGQ